MDCLRSFTITIDQTLTFTTSGVNVRTWNTGINHQWTVLDNVTESRFNVQGFKNINLYGIKMQGYCAPQITGTSGAIVDDFGFQMVIGGQNPILGGDFSTNGYNAVTTNQPINLTKFNSEFRFVTPIQSANFVEIGTFFAQGYGWQTASNIILTVNASFIVYYQFEGE
jgi:hypothetical protein